jgi:hypothetical protein
MRSEQHEYVRHFQRARRPGLRSSRRGEQREHVRHSTEVHCAHLVVGRHRQMSLDGRASTGWFRSALGFRV